MIPGFQSFQYCHSQPFTRSEKNLRVHDRSGLLFFRFFFYHPTGSYIIVDEILFFQYNFYVSNQSIQLENHHGFLFPQNELSYSK